MRPWLAELALAWLAVPWLTVPRLLPELARLQPVARLLAVQLLRLLAVAVSWLHVLHAGLHTGLRAWLLHLRLVAAIATISGRAVASCGRLLSTGLRARLLHLRLIAAISAVGLWHALGLLLRLLLRLRLEELVFLEVSAHLEVVDALLNFNERVVQLEVERVALNRHGRQLLLDGDGLVELLEELRLGGVGLNLAEHLLERLHLALNLGADLLLLLLKRGILGVVRLEEALVLGKYFLLGLCLRHRRHQVICRVC